MSEELKPARGAGSAGRVKLLLGGLLIVAAVVYLIASSTQAAAQYYITVDELAQKSEAVQGRDLKLAGAVDGDSITYDPATLTRGFTIAHVPEDMDEIEAAGGLAEALHQAVSDPTARRLQVVYVGPKPDLLPPPVDGPCVGSCSQICSLLLPCGLTSGGYGKCQNDCASFPPAQLACPTAHLTSASAMRRANREMHCAFARN